MAYAGKQMKIISGFRMPFLIGISEQERLMILM